MGHPLSLHPPFDLYMTSFTEPTVRPPIVYVHLCPSFLRPIGEQENGADDKGYDLELCEIHDSTEVAGVCRVFFGNLR